MMRTSKPGDVAVMSVAEDVRPAPLLAGPNSGV